VYAITWICDTELASICMTHHPVGPQTVDARTATAVEQHQ